MTTKTTVRELVVAAARHLEEAPHVARPRREAEAIACHLLGVDISYLLAHPEALVENKIRSSVESLTTRRGLGEPLAYIFGSAWFFGRRFRVTPAVLVPRPETELLAEDAVRAALSIGAKICLDIGTGSGILAVTLAIETGAAVVATDISRDALLVARQNAAFHRTTVLFVKADGAASFLRDTFDLVVANPPYVAPEEKETLPRDVRDHEPDLALYSPRGLDHLETWLAAAARLLRPSGRLFFEIGYGQREKAIAAARHAGLSDIAVRPDLASIPRVLSARSLPQELPAT